MTMFSSSLISSVMSNVLFIPYSLLFISHVVVFIFKLFDLDLFKYLSFTFLSIWNIVIITFNGLLNNYVSLPFWSWFQWIDFSPHCGSTLPSLCAWKIFAGVPEALLGPLGHG